MAVERRWLTVTEAAEYLGIHPKSLYRSCKKKEIPSSRSRGIGIRIDKIELDKLLERRGTKAVDEALGSAQLARGEKHAKEA